MALIPSALAAGFLNASAGVRSTDHTGTFALIAGSAHIPSHLSVVAEDLTESGPFPGHLPAAKFRFVADDHGLTLVSRETGQDEWALYSPKGGVEYHVRDSDVNVPKEAPVADKKDDGVEAPSHYTFLKDTLGVEPMDILIALFQNDALLWQVGKYIIRAGRKPGESMTKDLRKARRYLDERIKLSEASDAAN